MDLKSIVFVISISSLKSLLILFLSSVFSTKARSSFVGRYTRYTWVTVADIGQQIEDDGGLPHSRVSDDHIIDTLGKSFVTA